MYSVTLDDRLPRGLPEDDAGGEGGFDRALLYEEGWREELRGVPVERALGGAVALVFGRTAAGRSVCVRVEGFHPPLYFALDGSDRDAATAARESAAPPPPTTLPALRAELEAEVRHRLQGGIVRVTERSFAHFYHYEHDPAAPSGRVVHRYAEARYPSLAAWRAACQLRRDAELPRLERAVAATRAAADAGDAAAAAALPLEENRLARAREAWEASAGEEERDRAAAAAGGALPRPAQEFFVDPVTRFLHEADITPGRWYRVADARVVDARVSVCDHELAARLDGFRLVPERALDAPYTTLYYDIETMGLDPEAAAVIQVSLVFVRAGALDRHLVALHSVAPLEGVTVHACDGEARVLSTVRRLVLEHDPDFAVAYNGVNFDNAFLARRAEKLGVGDFWFLSRLALRPARLRELRLSSGGMGDNVLRYFDMPGRATFDWYIKLKRDLTSEPSYKLDHFARTLCGDQKEELASGLRWRRLRRPPEGGRRLEGCAALEEALRAGRREFAPAEWEALAGPAVAASLDAGHHARDADGAYYAPVDVGYRAIAPLQEGGPRDRARLGSYCVHDSVLLERLNVARTMITEILQFSAVFHVPPEWIYFRGQFVRAAAQMLRKARVVEAVPLLLQKPPGGWNGEGVAKFEGATVNEPDRGFYKEGGGVSVLDWKSLYPSIMMSYNLCPSTLLPPDAPAEVPFATTTHEIGMDFPARFVHRAHHRGVLPRILEELGAERTRAKREMKAHAKALKAAPPDSEEARRLAQLVSVADGRQLALKVSANSAYGLYGARNGYPCLAVSATTTLRGRDAMVVKKEVLPRHFPGIRVVYGDTDSVFVVFPEARDVAETARLSERAAEVVTDHFVRVLDLPWMELEFEKIYKPLLLEGKKRYMGIKYEPAGPDGAMACKGMDAKGVETERRDTLPYVKEIMIAVRDALMVDMDERKALAAFEARMDALVRDEVPMDKLILKKNLSSKVEGKTDVCAHARVNALRRAREAGSEASVNEQVEYVIVAGHRKLKTTELAEDPVYAREHGLRLNGLWYFEHCIEEAMRKVFEVCDVDYAGACRRYRALLDAGRLQVDRAAMEAALFGGGGDGGASSSGAGDGGGNGGAAAPVAVRRVPPPPRPPPPLPKRKKR